MTSFKPKEIAYDHIRAAGIKGIESKGHPLADLPQVDVVNRTNDVGGNKI